MKKGLAVILLLSAFCPGISHAQSKGYLKIEDLAALCQLNSDETETYLLDKGFEPRQTEPIGDCLAYAYNSENLISADLPNTFISIKCKDEYANCTFSTPEKTYFSSLKKSFTAGGFVFTGTTPPSGESSETKIYQKGKHEISTYTHVVLGVTIYAVQYWIIK